MPKKPGDVEGGWPILRWQRTRPVGLAFLEEAGLALGECGTGRHPAEPGVEGAARGANRSIVTAQQEGAADGLPPLTAGRRWRFVYMPAAKADCSMRASARLVSIPNCIVTAQRPSASGVTNQ